MFVINRRGLAKAAIAVAMTMSAAAVIAQRSAEPPGGATLADVAAELRQLRLAVEESTRRQTETHALGVFVSGQQSRLVQATTRVDGARRELDVVANRSNQLSTALTDSEAEIRSAKSEERPAFELRARRLKEELSRQIIWAING